MDSPVLVNPFEPGNPVSPSMFAGRQPELQRLDTILNQAANGKTRHLAIIGERGIGKTSLLRYLKAVATGKDVSKEGRRHHFVVVSCDMIGVQDYIEIAERLGRSFKSAVSEYEPARRACQSIWDFISKWEVLGVKYAGQPSTGSRNEALDNLTTLTLRTWERLKESFDGILFLVDEVDKPPSTAGLGRPTSHRNLNAVQCCKARAGACSECLDPDLLDLLGSVKGTGSGAGGVIMDCASVADAKRCRRQGRGINGKRGGVSVRDDDSQLRAKGVCVVGVAVD